MTTINSGISNGTCYYAENTETKGDFVPCGNSAIQAWPCCKLGSFCLSLGDANACWEAKCWSTTTKTMSKTPTTNPLPPSSAGNTYIAGCTDPSFGSPNCGRKPPAFHEQEWVPINQACKDLNANAKATNVTNWTGCKIDDNSTELVKLPLAACTPYCDTEHVIYAGSSSLAAFASLPVLRGSSIFWQNNYVPPPTPAPGYSPGTPTGVVGTFRPTATSTAPPSSDNDNNSELSPAAKAGVGVGAAVGGLLVIFAIAGLFILCLRRRRDRKNAETAAPPTGPGYDRYPPPETATYHFPAPSPSAVDGHHQHQQQPGSPPPPPFTTGTYPYHYQQAPRQDAEAYTGYKSELPADERFLPGHSPQPSAVSAVSAGSPPPPGSSISATPASAYGNTYDSR